MARSPISCAEDLIVVLRADSRAALDAERAELAATASERAETGTVTVTVAQTEPE